MGLQAAASFGSRFMSVAFSQCFIYKVLESSLLVIT